MKKRVNNSMSLKKARYFETCDNGTVRCTLCPHGCLIQNGKIGRCLVRTNIDGKLYAEGYGRITSIALDPIEKKPLRLFYPGSSILSVGSYGCNFSCRFCQNYTISQQQRMYKDILPEQLVEMALNAKSEGNIGIAYTYNEPFTAYEFIFDCAKLAKSRGLKNVIVTNGYINKEPLSELLPYIDAMNIDLKAFTDDFYHKLCGGSLQPVKDTIALCSKVCHVEITTLVIPGFNDTDEEIEAIAEFLESLSSEIPLHLTRHHPDFRMSEPLPISRQRLFALADVAGKHLKHIFTGNC